MTAQTPDFLIWRNLEHCIPNGGPLIDAWSEDQRPEFKASSTACWRGYVATWVVDDEGWLRVASVKSGFETRPVADEDVGDPGQEGFVAESLVRKEDRDAWLARLGPETSGKTRRELLEFFERMSSAPRRIRVVMAARERLYDLFPGHDGPVPAIWFTGELLTGHGDDIEWPNPYQAVYEHYRIFHVKEGKVFRIDDHDRAWWYERHPGAKFDPNWDLTDDGSGH